MGSTDLLIKQCDYTVGVTRVDTLDKSYDSINWFENVIPTITMFEVVDSMEMHFKTGKCLIYDASKMRAILPFTGNEVITIKYRNSLHGTEFPNKIVHFRIFNVQETQDQNKPNYPYQSHLLLNLIEFPAFEMFAIPNVYKTWEWDDDGENPKGVVVSEAVEELLKKVHNFDKWWDIEKDDTTNEDEDKVLFYSPNWTVMKSIEYLTQFAQKQGKKYPNYFFKTDIPKEEGQKPKILFKSLYTNLEKNEARPYQTQKPDQMYRKDATGEDGPTAPESEDGDSYDPVDTITAYHFDWGNANQLFANMSGETLINWDMKNSVNYHAYDFETFINEYKGLGFYSTLTEKPGREKKGVQWNRFNTCPWKKKKQVQNFMRNSMFKNYFNNSIKVDTKCYVNELRKAGEKVRLFFTAYEKDSKVDLMFSGNWMCWEIRDIIHGSGNASSEITFIKDSFFVQPEKPSNYVVKVSSFDDGRGEGNSG